MAEAPPQPNRTGFIRTDLWSLEEAQFVRDCAYRVLDALFYGASIGGTVMWFATQKLSKSARYGFTVGGSAILGYWAGQSSIFSNVDRCLSLKGSIVQKQFANEILYNYSQSPKLMQLITKHFYLEDVYDDVSANQPQIRWRYRNLLEDSVAESQTVHDSRSPINTENRETDLGLKHFSVSPGIDTMEDPFECILGDTGSEVILTSGTSNTLPRVVSRRHRKSRLKHRARHREVPS